MYTVFLKFKNINLHIQLFYYYQLRLPEFDFKKDLEPEDEDRLIKQLKASHKFDDLADDICHTMNNKYISGRMFIAMPYECAPEYDFYICKQYNLPAFLYDYVILNYSYYIYKHFNEFNYALGYYKLLLRKKYLELHPVFREFLKYTKECIYSKEFDTRAILTYYNLKYKEFHIYKICEAIYEQAWAVLLYTISLEDLNKSLELGTLKPINRTLEGVEEDESILFILDSNDTHINNAKYIRYCYTNNYSKTLTASQIDRIYKDVIFETGLIHSLVNF